MKKAMHAKPFRLHAPGHKARHARPESPRTRVVRAVSVPGLHLPAGHGHGIPGFGGHGQQQYVQPAEQAEQAVAVHQAA